jgi:glycosyltransferase involved in cell wall biosynthesis
VTKRVYFHIGRFGHPFFSEQLRAAPDEFTYATSDAAVSNAVATRRISLQGTPLRRLRSGLEPIAIRGLSWSGYVRRTKLGPIPDCSLIHSAQQLLCGELPVPYVVDFECVEVFCMYQRIVLARPWARRVLLAALSDERCRFLLPWTEASRRGLEAALGADGAQRLRVKTRTILPAICPRASHPSQRYGGPLRALFIGTAFEAKGGVEAIRAVQRARATHDVVLDVLSDVPSRWQQKVAQVAEVTIHSWPVPAVRVRELFEQAHVLVFPSHMDTLGFVILEAMAHGIPVLAGRHFSIPELVEDGVSGVLVDAENGLYGEDGLSRFDYTIPLPRALSRSLAAPSDAYVERLASALASLAEDRALHERLAGGALARVLDGPLSMAHRREALGRVYHEALAG